jgi:predicted nucleotide-binding protein (sugar kinase/HSP70/actin superfamily)
MDKTILFGGLTPIHELFIKGALESFGYRAQFLPNPDNDSLKVGRELCNRGMCNPTYYTVGNLIKFLKEQAEKGVDVEKEFLFVTVGACGPCRFGMYEREYRLALKNAGFENFSLSILNQSELSSEGELELTGSLIWALVKALWLADILRELGYQLRPYEVDEGSTGELLSEYEKEIYQALRGGASVLELFRLLVKLKEALNSLKYDYTRVKPVVAVIGEFWAHTTESEGNYNLHRWLEEEGAEVKVEPIAGWIDYQLFLEAEKLKRDLKVKGFSLDRLKRLTLVKGMAFTFRALYELFRGALDFRPRPLPSQKLLAKLAKPYFDYFVVGGEGHLEVAKHIYYLKSRKAHMVLSVKPFGCMPSTQSDGAQAKVLSDYPESIFLSVETSGDGEVNVKSRVQMKLHEAKLSALEEYDSLLRELNATFSEVKKLFSRRELTKAFVPLKGKFAGTAARALWASRTKLQALLSCCPEVS